MTTESQPIRERKVTICPVFFVSVLLPFYSCPGPLYLTWGDKSSTKAHKGDLGLSVVFYLSNLQHLSSLTKVGGAEEKAAAHRRRLGRKPGDEGGRGRQRSFLKSAVSLALILSSAHRSAICPQTGCARVCSPFSSILRRKPIRTGVNTLPAGSATVLRPT